MVETSGLVFLKAMFSVLDFYYLVSDKFVKYYLVLISTDITHLCNKEKHIIKV